MQIKYKILILYKIIYLKCDQAKIPKEYNFPTATEQYA